METILNVGINWIVALQSLGGWLTLPMKFFSSLGTEEFYMLVLPVLYWCINSSLGTQVAFILMISGGVNEAFKMAFHGPRPYWYSSQVEGLAAETSFGVPSGHAQNAISVWGIMAAGIRKWWAWLLASHRHRFADRPGGTGNASQDNSATWEPIAGDVTTTSYVWDVSRLLPGTQI